MAEYKHRALSDKVAALCRDFLKERQFGTAAKLATAAWRTQKLVGTDKWTMVLAALEKTIIKDGKKGFDELPGKPHNPDDLRFVEAMKEMEDLKEAEAQKETFRILRRLDSPKQKMR